MIKCAATVGTSEDITGGPTDANNLRFLLERQERGNLSRSKGMIYLSPLNLPGDT